MGIMQFVQHLSCGFRTAAFHLEVVKSAAKTGILVQIWRRALGDEARQDIYQDRFIGSQVGDDIFDGPNPTGSLGVPARFWKAVNGLQKGTLSVLQDVLSVHMLCLSVKLSLIHSSKLSLIHSSRQLLGHVLARVQGLAFDDDYCHAGMA